MVDGKFGPLWFGTVVWVIIGVGCCIIGQMFKFKGSISSGENALLRFFVFTAIVCMWMMWAMTWLSQVNPVLYPIVTKH